MIQCVRQSGAHPLVARGAGRSYGDAALNRDGRIIDCSRLRGIESFDPATGEVVVEAGVTFGDLLDSLGDSGWIAPVTPGTQFATIGGAIANDVHGKDHDRNGSIGNHVHWMDLVLPNGNISRISPQDTPDLFAATVGGIGLTGFIARTSLQMKRIQGSGVKLRERRARDLDEYFALLAEARTTSHYSVGWIDGLASRHRLGRGILETAEHFDGPVETSRRKAWRVPDVFPSWTINRHTVRAFNEIYYRRIAGGGRSRNLDYRRFFYPLDAMLNWNNLYGRRGFIQFQCVIPEEVSRPGIRTILSTIVASRNASFLAVIKTMGSHGKGFLSFPMKGLTLAMDFPVRAGLRRLLDSLHAIVIEFGGRVYLAKDACLRPDQFRRMYPRVAEFQAVLESIDPERRIRSDMIERLKL